jgi:hypothetical protein
MKSRLLIFAITSIVMASAAWAGAGAGQIARPPIIIRPLPVQPAPAPVPNDQFIAQLAEGDNPTVLVIPRDAFANPAPHADATNVSPAPTIVAGFALSAAITVGALQLARGKRRNGAILLVAAALGISMIARALYAADSPLEPPPGIGHHGPVEVDLTSQATAVRVTLSRDLAAFLTADALGNN